MSTPTTPVIVRTVAPADVERCAAIEAACFPPEEAASPERVAQRATAFARGFLVAELDGVLFGMANGAASHRPDLADEEFKALVGHEPDGANLVIFSLAVHPDFQGRSLSTPLVNAYLERAREDGRRAVLLLCKERLVPYYARFGFIDRGLSASTHGGARWHEMAVTL
ncbi:Acetyltransferase (GNAT) family protein [Planctomycetes bacterium Pla163]|uniref:Acetyltransferase (GNAT) family protein n=1 Tax=Rohdeia mirabilis TaxID=2528008 RepID=A0A518CWV4_9BACT|nr:Acetyltransferase (GNAT) family protein [Planctomycetes bacterium Pla163]